MINLIKNIIKNILGIASIPLTKLFKPNPSISVLIFHHVDKKDFASFKKRHNSFSIIFFSSILIISNQNK